MLEKIRSNKKDIFPGKCSCGNSKNETCRLDCLSERLCPIASPCETIKLSIHKPRVHICSLYVGQYLRSIVWTCSSKVSYSHSSPPTSHMEIHICRHTLTCTRMNTHMQVHSCTHRRPHHGHLHVWAMSTHMHPLTYLCTHVQMLTYMHVGTHTHTQKCTHAHTHTRHKCTCKQNLSLSRTLMHTITNTCKHKWMHWNPHTETHNMHKHTCTVWTHMHTPHVYSHMNIHAETQPYTQMCSCTHTHLHMQMYTGTCRVKWHFWNS